MVRGKKALWSSFKENWKERFFLPSWASPLNPQLREMETESDELQSGRQFTKEELPFWISHYGLNYLSNYCHIFWCLLYVPHGMILLHLPYVMHRYLLFLALIYRWDNGYIVGMVVNHLDCIWNHIRNPHLGVSVRMRQVAWKERLILYVGCAILQTEVSE